ncbi:MAG: pyruvate:ferredoxin (flavodoxin) oxidoreductase [Bacilli bacterium]
MKKYNIMDGNEACATAAYMFSEVCGIYPITPSSTMATLCDKWSQEGKKNIFNDKVNVVQMQSEAGAAGLVHGSLQGGTLTTTFTASQGLLLMIPSMYKMAGEMLPCVIHCAARSLATHALSIFGDHQDVYACRSTGFAMLSSVNVQDAYNLAIVAHLSSIESSIPFMHFFDGFRTSHELNKISILEDKEVLSLVDYNLINEFKMRSLNIGKCITRGTSQTEDIYFQNTEARNKYYDEVADIVNKNMQKINKITSSSYKPFEYYGSPNAKKIIVAMGSVCDTIKLTIDANNEELGLIICHLYRPFSYKYFINVLPSTVKSIAVLDRTKEAGSAGEPLYLDVCSILKDKHLNIVGGRYGLSSRNTTPEDIQGVYDNLNNEKPLNNFTIGIIDDVTHLSLNKGTLNIKTTSKEVKVFGFGSDGMVGGVKNVLKVIGQKTNTFIQGYFEYDSKKSGGVTIGHVRINNKSINAPFYPTNPSIIYVTKESYLHKFDCINNINKDGKFLLCTSKDEKELDTFLPNHIKKIIKEKNITFYTCDTDKLNKDFELRGKINSVVSYYLLEMLGGTKTDTDNFKSIIKKEYGNKGEAIVKKNIDSIENAYNYLNEVDINKLTITKEKEIDEHKTLTQTLLERKGGELKVSDFIDYRDGTFEGSTSALDKRRVTQLVPKWNKDTCLTCNQCAFVCPHGVIRPYELTKEECEKAHININDTKEIPNSDKRFYLSINESLCTGCTLCQNTCPSKEKSIYMGPYDEEKQRISDYLSNNITNTVTYNKYTVKGIGYETPSFEFPGACAGCGETPYLRVLTNLYGKEIVIANATGCSSIYGASLPCTPYKIPWINSLFEDNAEFGLGLHTSYKTLRNRVYNIMNESIEVVNNDVKELYNKWLNNINNFDITQSIKEELKEKEIPQDLKLLLDYIPSRTVWIIGGDGWAYDIGYGGLDHVLSSNENIKILVLDTEVYSNTGGQRSKSTQIGAVAEFASTGKYNYKKDLFKIAMNIPNVFVASVCLGGNMQQTIKSFKEAQEHDGPSLIIAYSPCISHGIKGGMKNVLNEEKLLVDSGYNLLMRYNPKENKLTIDSKEPDFNKYKEVFESELRYKNLPTLNPKDYEQLYNKNIEYAKKRYETFKKMQ